MGLEISNKEKLSSTLITESSIGTVVWKIEYEEMFLGSSFSGTNMIVRCCYFKCHLMLPIACLLYCNFIYKYGVSLVFHSLFFQNKAKQNCAHNLF